MASNTNKSFTFIGVPTHSGQIGIGTVQAILKAPKLSDCVVHMNCCSLLAHNFNSIFCTALNLKESGAVPLTHFCLLHADIVPVQPNWLNIMIAEMEKHDLDVLSAVVPIKDGRGLTSTGVCMSDPNAAIKGDVRRLTLQETMKLPTTFTGPDLIGRLEGWEGDCATLLVNSGLLVMDLRHAPVHEYLFTINDEIRTLTTGEQTEPGISRVARTEPEDWFFSRLLHELGVSYGATRAVDVKHCGVFDFDSRIAWGHEHDPSLFPVSDDNKESENAVIATGSV